VEPNPLDGDPREERVGLGQAAGEGRGGDYQWLHRQLGEAQHLTDRVERPPAVRRDNEEVDVAALMLVSPREGAEQIHLLGSQLVGQPASERR